MNIKRFTAPTSREALAKARMAFGEGTLILSNRPTANGVEVVATAEDTLSALDSAAQGSGSPAPQGGRDFQDSRPHDDDRLGSKNNHRAAPRATQMGAPRQPPQPGGRRHRTAGNEHTVVPGLRARAHAAPPP